MYTLLWKTEKQTQQNGVPVWLYVGTLMYSRCRVIEDREIRNSDRKSENKSATDKKRDKKK